MRQRLKISSDTKHPLVRASFLFDCAMLSLYSTGERVVLYCHVPAGWGKKRDVPAPFHPWGSHQILHRFRMGLGFATNPNRERRDMKPPGVKVTATGCSLLGWVVVSVSLHNIALVFMCSSHAKYLHSCGLSAEKLKHLELHCDQVECGGGRQDGGIGPEEAAQRCTAVPEEQRVPGQQAGTKIRLANQHRDLIATHTHSLGSHILYSSINFHIISLYT